MNWDPAKLCGPVIMSSGGFPEGNCCFYHAKGTHLHDPPTVNGKPFALADHKERFERLGLTTVKQELVEMRRANGKPKGSTV